LFTVLRIAFLAERERERVLQVTKPNPFAFLPRQQRSGTAHCVTDDSSDSSSSSSEEMDLSVHRFRPQKTTFQHQRQSESDETLLESCVDDGTPRRLRCLRAVSRSITRSSVQLARPPPAPAQVRDDDDDDDDVSSDDNRLNTTTIHSAPAVSHASSEVLAWRRVDTHGFVQHVQQQPSDNGFPCIQFLMLFRQIRLYHRVSFINAYINVTVAATLQTKRCDMCLIGY